MVLALLYSGRTTENLGTIYLWRREPQKTLDLAVRFPDDDEPYLSFAKVIALRHSKKKNISRNNSLRTRPSRNRQPSEIANRDW